jgi:hypothetical protein
MTLSLFFSLFSFSFLIAYIRPSAPHQWDSKDRKRYTIETLTKNTTSDIGLPDGTYIYSFIISCKKSQLGYILEIL